jgi:hypothetical protein
MVRDQARMLRSARVEHGQRSRARGTKVPILVLLRRLRRVGGAEPLTASTRNPFVGIGTAAPEGAGARRLRDHSDGEDIPQVHGLERAGPDDLDELPIDLCHR